ncbi:MAG: hypothetical protein O3B47_04830 [bacterium]|nr:hypothetical protein [bacterium]
MFQEKRLLKKMPTQSEVIDTLGSQLPEKTNAHFQKVKRNNFENIEGAKEMVVLMPEEDPKNILQHPVLGPILKPYADSGALFAERRSPVDREKGTSLKHPVISIPVSNMGSIEVIHLISGSSAEGKADGDDEFHVPRKVRSSLAEIKNVVGDIVNQDDDSIAIYLDGKIVKHENAEHYLRALGKGMGNITYETDHYRSEPGEISKDGELSQVEKAELEAALNDGWTPKNKEATDEAKYAALRKDIELNFWQPGTPDEVIKTTRNALADVYIVSDAKGKVEADALIASFETGDMISRVQSLCKFLSEAPHSLLNCETFVRVLHKLNEYVSAMGNNTEIEIWGPEIEGIKVNGSTNKYGKKLGVLEALHAGSGKEIGPFVVTMRYRHPEAVGQPVHILAGKSIMFDTGGYGSKLANANHMQGDMMGGASVAAEFARFGEEKPAMNVDFVFGIASNKISGDARVQEDIHRHGSGMNREEAHTDAEGREALGDTVWLALRRVKERGENVGSVTTIATLTGAAIIVSGHQTIAVSKSKKDRRWMEDTSQINGDRMHPLQLNIEDKKASDHTATDQADIKNLGQERKRGAQNAGSYIKEAAGIKDTRFMHLDIAPAMTADKLGTPKDVQGVFACEGYLDTLHEWMKHLAQN